jgi:DNA-binding SARP family transcriptional activator
LRFQLLGKFLAQRNQQKLPGLEAGKEQELLCYLLVHRNRPHAREALASLLWANTSTDRSKKYLRQALWHLASALVENDGDPRLLQIEHDWVQLNLHAGIWVDVAVFDHAATAAQGVAGAQLDSTTLTMLKEAVALYKGDLLEGWYQDWCLFERERFQNTYFLILDKLMAHAAAHGDYEAGQTYGATILSYDRASEVTYRRLMKLRYEAGDRTGALRQYQRCVTALHEELGVKPERRTQQLYEQIKSDGLVAESAAEPAFEIASANTTAPDSSFSLPNVLGRLRRLRHVLTAAQNQVQRDIIAVEEALRTKTTK